MITKADLEAINQRLSLDNTLMLQVLNDLAVGREPDGTEKVSRGSEGKYLLKLYRAAGAVGGILVVTFFCAGQNPSTSVYRLDDFDSSDLDLRTARDRLRTTRNQIIASGMK